MALTADQITAQNFKDFYGQIRPYLNGQVPTFANAFNRSDLYSETEKIVGSWIDGKPLYQKAIDVSPLPNNKKKTISSGLTGVQVVSMRGYAHRPTGTDVVIPLPQVPSGTLAETVKLAYNQTSSMIEITTTTDFSAYTDAYVILQYTKTSDSAIKVGTGNDYSTDEQIIGSYVDGKPIYQKTLTGTSGSSSISVANLSIDTVVDLAGVIGTVPINWSYSGNSASVWVSSNKQTVEMAVTSSYSNKDYHITLRYTKTTD